MCWYHFLSLVSLCSELPAKIVACNLKVSWSLYANVFVSILETWRMVLVCLS